MNDGEKMVEILTFGGGAQHWRQVIESRVPGVGVRDQSRLNGRPHNLDRVRVLIGWKFPDALFDLLPALEWIQCLSVGVDTLIANSHIPPNVRITNTGRLYGDAIAEYVLWCILTLSRQFHTLVANQRRRRWRQVFGRGLAGQTIGIVGVGNVGSHVARLAAALQMRAVGFVRDEKARGHHPCIDAMVPISGLADRVGELDALVVCLPLTEATRGIVSREVIDRMKRTAVIVNVSRAGVVENSALIDAVQGGMIAGAAIDVFDKEPLRPWSRLWRIDNLLVTPHTAAMRDDYKTRVADLLTDNVVRFTTGRPLLNEIERSTGY